MMQENYNPHQGWLGFLMGSALYYKFWDPKKHIKEEGDRIIAEAKKYSTGKVKPALTPAKGYDKIRTGPYGVPLDQVTKQKKYHKQLTLDQKVKIRHAYDAGGIPKGAIGTVEEIHPDGRVVVKFEQSNTRVGFFKDEVGSYL